MVPVINKATKSRKEEDRIEKGRSELRPEGAGADRHGPEESAARAVGLIREE